MLANIQPPFKNAQGDQFPGALIVIEDGTYETEEISKVQYTFTRQNAENYKVDNKDLGSEEPVISGTIKYTAQYWTQAANFQQGKKGYWLESKTDDVEFALKLDEEWSAKFNSIEGTPEQRVTKLCEMHVKEVILPSLRV